MPPRTIALLVGINLLWGGASLAAKYALGTANHPGIPPMTLAFARFSLSALLMYAVARALRVNLAVARRDWARFWAMGAMGLALTYLLAYAGLSRTTASDNALLVATEPVFLALLSVVFLREAMPRPKIVGIGCGLLGVYFIVNHGWRLNAFSGRAMGDMLIALGLCFEASSSILGKGLVARYPAVSVITYQMTAGAIMLAPFAVGEMAHAARGGHPVGLPSPEALWSVAYLVLPCTVIAYTVWFTLLDRRAAGEMAVFLFIQPVVGAALGAFCLHEPITAWTIGGAALVLSGIALLNRRPALPALPTLPPSA